ncbi:17994_t:CDS:2 [Gigaspora margarita]|uniref:17994_t:CDS:1 n=1 Tax=Gigaspora margarita TaxID=4874 RepID=A0ABN7U9Z1_GIGMA|nr:17994_t:CDS:2 [Gigaspora margarita]
MYWKLKQRYEKVTINNYWENIFFKNNPQVSNINQINKNPTTSYDPAKIEANGHRILRKLEVNT